MNSRQTRMFYRMIKMTLGLIVSVLLCARHSLAAENNPKPVAGDLEQGFLNPPDSATCVPMGRSWSRRNSRVARCAVCASSARWAKTAWYNTRGPAPRSRLFEMGSWPKQSAASGSRSRRRSERAASYTPSKINPGFHKSIRKGEMNCMSGPGKPAHHVGQRVAVQGHFSAPALPACGGWCGWSRRW